MESSVLKIMDRVILICVLGVFTTFVYGQLEIKFFTPAEEILFDQCAEEYEVRINKTEFEINGIIPDEDNFPSKCVFYCVPYRLRITNESGFIDNRSLEALIIERHPSAPLAAVRAVIKKCTRRQYVDICERWYQVTKCIWNMYRKSMKHRQNHQN